MPNAAPQILVYRLTDGFLIVTDAGDSIACSNSRVLAARIRKLADQPGESSGLVIPFPANPAERQPRRLQQGAPVPVDDDDDEFDPASEQTRREMHNLGLLSKALKEGSIGVEVFWQKVAELCPSLDEGLIRGQLQQLMG